MWPIKLHFLSFILCTLLFLLDYMDYFFISHTTEQTKFLRPSLSPQFSTLQLFMICFLQCAMFSIIQITWCKWSSLLVSSKQLSPICCWKHILLSNTAFARTVLDLIFHVHLALFDVMLNKYLNHSKLYNCYSLSCSVILDVCFRLTSP